MTPVVAPPQPASGWMCLCGDTECQGYDQAAWKFGTHIRRKQELRNRCARAVHASICVRHLTLSFGRHVCYELWLLTPIFEKGDETSMPERKSVEARLRPLCDRGAAQAAAAAAASGNPAPPKRKLQTYNAFQTAWRNNRKQLQEAFQHLVPTAPATPCPSD